MPALARRYADVVEVQRRDDLPERFVWRGRAYTVRAVLDHWLLTAPWWDAPPPTPTDHVGVAGATDDEREFWRVVAVPGGAATVVKGGTVVMRTVVVELCFAWSTGRWTLARLFD